MELKDTETQILERKILEIETAIIDDKVAIAEAFLKVHRTLESSDIKEPKDLAVAFKGMNSLSNLEKELSKKEDTLNAFLAYKSELEQTNSELIAK